MAQTFRRRPTLHGARRREGGISLIEIIACLVCLIVLVSFAVAGYQRYRDRTAMLMDETNQKVLQAAVKLYAYDTGALPGTLSELSPEQLSRAYALVTDGKRPTTVLVFLWESVGAAMAEAVPLPGKYYNNDLNAITCPSDPTPPAKGGYSYALSTGWVNRPFKDLLDPRNADEDLIVESDLPVARTDDAGGQVAYRHGRGRLTVSTSVRGEHRRRGNQSGPKGRR